MLRDGVTDITVILTERIIKHIGTLSLSYLRPTQPIAPSRTSGFSHRAQHLFSQQYSTFIFLFYFQIKKQISLKCHPELVEGPSHIKQENKRAVLPTLKTRAETQR